LQNQTAKFNSRFFGLEHYQKQWTERIDSFEKYVNKLKKNK